MRRSVPAESDLDKARPTVPAGAPAWVTPELIANTLDTWQPYYGNSLTSLDALEILMTVTRLFDRLDLTDAETVYRISESQLS